MSKFFTVYEFWNVISTIWCIAEKNKIYRIIKSRCMIPPLSVGMMLRKARLHKLGFKGFAELFVLCNILLCGLLDVALKFTDFLHDSKKDWKKYIALLVRIDIAVLILRWKVQLQGFFERKVWLDIDQQGFQDNLSRCFAMEMQKYLYDAVIEIERGEFSGVDRKLKIFFIKSMMIYYESRYDFNKAFEYCQKGLIIDRRDGLFLEKKCFFTNFFSLSYNESLVDRFAAFYVSKNVTVDDMQKYGLVESRTIKTESDYKFSVHYFYKSRHFSNNFHYTHTLPQKIITGRNISSLSGGILVSYVDGSYYLLTDTLNLDFSHLNMFTTEIVTYDTAKSIVVKKRMLRPFVCERAFIINDTGWSYYHWMYETLPCIKLYYDSGLNREMPIMFSYKLTKWQKESLHLIWGDNINVSDKLAVNVMVKDAYFANKSSRELIPSTESIYFLRDVFSRFQTVSSLSIRKKVFISRKGVKAVRSMLNIDEVEKWALDHGFIIVNPLDMSFKEQVNFFSDVDFILAEGGAALSNLVMCPSHTKVIIMAASRAWSETFSSLASRLGQTMVAVFGDGYPIINPYYIWTAFNFSISIDDLDNAYAYLVGQKPACVAINES